MAKIKSFDNDTIIDLISELDKSLFCDKGLMNESEKYLLKKLKKEINPKDFSAKTVLGIDIYHYSQYKPLEQTLIPILFKIIFEQVSSLCILNSSYVFQKYKNAETFNKLFINAGDGGFQIFDTPIHAIAYAINFQMVVRYYNSGRFYPKLRKIVGPINLRYAMTTDKIYKLNKDFYGPAIINNARILSKDSLNRFLLDKNTYDWFLQNINGIENLQLVSLNQIDELDDFTDYDFSENENINEIYPKKLGFNFDKIITSDIQKIGKIETKLSQLSIYNLHLQYQGSLSDKNQMTIVSLGNLNTSGIS
jgi:hypothetical protein